MPGNPRPTPDIPFGRPAWMSASQPNNHLRRPAAGSRSGS